MPYRSPARNNAKCTAWMDARPMMRGMLGIDPGLKKRWLYFLQFRVKCARTAHPPTMYPYMMLRRQGGIASAL